MIDGEVDGGDRGERGETDQEREREKQLKRDVAERETRVRETGAPSQMDPYALRTGEDLRGSDRCMQYVNSSTLLGVSFTDHIAYTKQILSDLHNCMCIGVHLGLDWTRFGAVVSELGRGPIFVSLPI